MATTKTTQSTKLLLSVETGTGADGSMTYGQRAIRNVNPALSDDNAYDVAEAVGSLQTLPVESIARQDTSLLTRE